MCEMKWALPALLGLTLLCAAPLSAQTLLPPVEVPQIEVPQTEVVESPFAERARPYRYWVSSEYLLWSLKGTPYPLPLVSTGNPAVGFPVTNTAGAIGQPGTRVLLGNENVGFGAFSGGRMTLGWWSDDDANVGLEMSGFLLERRNSKYVATSDAAGNPPLYFPAFDVFTKAEEALPISDPLRLFRGDVFVTSDIQLFGGEVNGLFNVARDARSELNFLLGFRYVDLRENLHIHNTTTDLLLANVQQSDDTFATRNQFYGGQLGARGSWRGDLLSLDLTGKVAMGSTRQVVKAFGQTSEAALPGGFAPKAGTANQGIYTFGTNSGTRSDNQFSVIPSLEAKLGYQFTPRVRFTTGYEIFWWNQVVRPGMQIDRNINPTQHPIFNIGNLIGPASPTALFNRTDFWAQGVNFGMEVRY